MAWTYNNNEYEVVKKCQWYHPMDQKKNRVNQGDIIGSFAVNNIIITNKDELKLVQELDGQPYIDKMVELGYVKIKI